MYVQTTNSSDREVFEVRLSPHKQVHLYIFSNVISTAAYTGATYRDDRTAIQALSAQLNYCYNVIMTKNGGDKLVMYCKQGSTIETAFKPLTRHEA